MSFIMLSGFIIFFYSIFLLKIALLIPNKSNFLMIFFNLKKTKQNYKGIKIYEVQKKHQWWQQHAFLALTINAGQACAPAEQSTYLLKRFRPMR